MRGWWLSIVVACGSEPPPAKPIAPPPRAAIAATSCADAGVILRGPVEVHSPDGPAAREAAISSVCKRDHWPANVLDCIGSSRTPQACIEKLSPQLEVSYQMALAEWAAKYEASSDLDERQATISCDAVVDAVDRISGDVTVERDWVIGARKRVVGTSCKTGWSQTTRQCLTANPPASDALTSCVFREPTTGVLAGELAAISSRAAAIAAAKAKPASITCAKVVAAYYADAKWQDPTLARLSPADRRRAIASSRTAMQHTCTKDAWDDTMRACLATGGDAATCFDGTSVVGWSWGYPAASAGISVLPPECDDFRKLVARLTTCTSLSIATRETIAASQVMLEREAARPDTAASCAATAQQLQASLQGC